MIKPHAIGTSLSNDHSMGHDQQLPLTVITKEGHYLGL